MGRQAIPRVSSRIGNYGDTTLPGERVLCSVFCVLGNPRDAGLDSLSRSTGHAEHPRPRSRSFGRTETSGGSPHEHKPPVSPSPAFWLTPSCRALRSRVYTQIVGLPCAVSRRWLERDHIVKPGLWSRHMPGEVRGCPRGEEEVVLGTARARRRRLIPLEILSHRAGPVRLTAEGGG